ncbi:CAAX prenyl protease 2 isoform X2 [Triticum aestivum]|uniref:CAAX prenyl protease 2 isoform X2 n=1 Tax=Triticum aestivum TaxID=4565 RepID=UPI001D0160D0|nr:CAAX prenyl protease 2-like isoform X2 [Triticum aestivum]
MATPAGSHPASPPAIPGKAAVAACAAMAVSYVAVLYAPTLLLRLPPATSLRAFFHRRFVCAAVSSAASVLATAALLGVWSLSDSSKALAVFGIRSDHLLEAVVVPLLLTSLVYAGSFVARLWAMSSSCGTDDDGVGVSCTEKLARWMQTSLQDVMVWRNYVVAPFTEELVFRACMIPLLLCGGFKMYNIIFLSPIFFSLAHLNHLFELHQQGCNFMRSLLIVGVQLGYTVIFGWYAAFLFIRTVRMLLKTKQCNARTLRMQKVFAWKTPPQTLLLPHAGDLCGLWQRFGDSAHLPYQCMHRGRMMFSTVMPNID